MSIVLQGSTSGSITLQEPAIAGSTVLSLPATTGTVLTSASPASDLPSSINGPAFSAYQNSDQTIATSSATKVIYDTEIFDTNNNFASNRFTPTVAGYYQISAAIQMQGGASGSTTLFIYKNGSNYTQMAQLPQSTANNPVINGSVLVYCNGSTDYLEIYCAQSTGGNRTLYGVGSSGGSNYFTGVLVRAA